MELNRLIAERLARQKYTSSQLNPLLFDGDKLKPDIREKILEIVDEFIKYLDVDIKIADIRLVGSNASYNYSKDSDLDIHIVTDLSKISNPETIARLYFDSAKKNFKDSYDITIKGIDVEMYVEDINATAVSNGVYSVTRDTWIKKPEEIGEPDEETLSQADEIEDKFLDYIEKAKSVNDLEDIIDNLYLVRKDSLSSEGELGAGNLAFKSLRNKGILDKIKDILRDNKSKELSLENKQIEESSDTFRAGKSTYGRDKQYGVGKKIGGQLYFHKNYVDRVCPHLYELAKDILEEQYPNFKYNCLMYDKSKPDTLRFDEAPDFDTAREPTPGNMMTVNTSTGEITKGKSPQIWHHKWMWVMDDYNGFDVDKSYQWSKTWTQKISHPSGYMNKWKQELADAGLE